MVIRLIGVTHAFHMVQNDKQPTVLIELYRQVNFLSNCDTALSKLFCGRVICLTSIVAYMLSLCFLSVSYLVDRHAFSYCGYPYPWFNSCLCQLCSGLTERTCLKMLFIHINRTTFTYKGLWFSKSWEPNGLP